MNYKLIQEIPGSIQLPFPKDLKIDHVFRVENSFLWKRYQNQLQILMERNGKKPNERLMYHLTSVENALDVSKHGFIVNRSKMRAFGKGVNLCTSLEDVLNFHRIYKNKKNLYSILVCQVAYSQAHANSSDDNKIITNEDGSYFTKPRYMTPKRGFDCMFSDKPRKKIWVIRSQARVYPSFILNVRIDS